MRTAVIGLVGVAAAGVYAASGGDGVHHERIVDASPQVVFNALAHGASNFDGQTSQTFSRGPDGKHWPITYRFEAKPNTYVSLVATANNAVIADIAFTIEPAEGGKTKLSADIDLDGGPVGMKPNFALLEIASGKALDATVASIENGINPSLKGWDYATAMGEAERGRAAERGIHPDDPARTVRAHRREREEAMRDAARPMVDVRKPSRGHDGY